MVNLLPQGVLTAVVLSIWWLGVTAIGLVEIYLLSTKGMLPTLSELAWDCPLFGVPIVVWLLIGPVYVILHFYFGVDGPRVGM